MDKRQGTERRQVSVPVAGERRHGERRMYRSGCHCTPCRAAEAAYRANLRSRHARGRPILGAHVAAGDTWHLLRQLKPEFGSYGAIALLLGYGYPMLQFGRHAITERTRRKIARLCRERLAVNTDLPSSAAV